MLECVHIANPWNNKCGRNKRKGKANTSNRMCFTCIDLISRISKLNRWTFFSTWNAVSARSVQSIVILFQLVTCFSMWCILPLFWHDTKLKQLENGISTSDFYCLSNDIACKSILFLYFVCPFYESLPRNPPTMYNTCRKTPIGVAS